VVIALALDGNAIGANISGISDVRFADDICLAAGNINDLQHLLETKFSSRFG